MSNPEDKTNPLQPRKEAGKAGLNKGRGLWIAGMVAVILIVGVLFAFWTVSQADREMRADLLLQARMLAQAVDTENVKALTGTEADLNKPDYLRLKEQFAAVKHANDKYRFIYLLGRKAALAEPVRKSGQAGGTVFFVDNEPPDSNDYSPPGQIYDEVSKVLLRVFDTRIEAVEGPVSDSWGTWVSALVPITDPVTGKLIAVLGIDINALTWKWNLTARAALPVGLTLVLLIGVAAYFSTRRVNVAPKPVLRSLMLPLAAAMLVLIAGFAILMLVQQEDQLNESSRQVLKEASSGMSLELAKQSRMLAALEEVLVQDKGLCEALKARDRQRLLADFLPVFIKLKEKHSITHFYFLDPKRICLLRVHNPKQYGDHINQFTELKAELTGRTATGIELGRWGTFTLRVVQPVFDNRTLIGYLELGKEIEDILAGIQKQSGVELAATIHKSLLKRSDWESGMKMLGRETSWERFPEDVLIYSSLSPFPAETGRFVGAANHTNGGKPIEARFNGSTWRIMISSLQDTSGADVGELFVLKDISEAKAAHWRLLAIGFGILLVLLAGLFAFLFVLLRRTDVGIRSQQKDIKESEERYRNILDNMQDAYFEMDLAGNITFINEATCRSLGYAREELIGRNYRMVAAGEAEVKTAYEIYNKVFQTGEPNKGVAFKVVRKDGREGYAETSISLLKDKHGNTIGFRSVARDITEKMLAEEKIRQSEERYRLLSEHTLDSVWLMDLNFKVIYQSPSVLKMSGFTAQEIMEMPLEKYITPESLKLVSEMISRESPKIKDDPTYNPIMTMELEYYHKNGTTLWTENKISIIRDESCRPVSILGETRDITERKLAEKKLRESEDLYRLLSEHTTDSVWMMDMNFKTTYHSPSVEKKRGFTPLEIIEMPFEQNLAPASLELVSEVVLREMPLIEADPGYNPVITLDLEYYCKDGTTKWAENKFSVIRDPGGRPISIIGEARDITGRKSAEDALRESETQKKAILNGITSNIALVDKDLNILWSNKTAAASVKKLPEEMIGRTCHSLWADPDKPCDQCPSLRAFHTKQSEHVIIRTPDGRFWDERGEPVCDAEGNVVAVVEIAQDITDIKQGEEEREKLQEQLNQAQKMESVGRLAGGVAHDFNNMLGVILGHAELAMMQTDPEQPLYNDLQEIRKAAERSAGLTRQLLAFARKQTVAPKVLDLNETVEGMLKMLLRLIGEDIDLVWLPGKNLSLVKLDPSQIDQILANLLVNARDAIAGEGKVTIETQNASLDKAYCDDHVGLVPGDYVMLAVSDNGCGMDKETLANIFEPFFTTKGVGEGTGLGLSTVYGIVRQNNGFVNVYSEPGHGTTFRIYLPWYLGKTGQIQTRDLSAPAEHGQETILLVEDEPAILNMTISMLQHLGYTGLAASGSGEAIRLAQTYVGEIHLLITDVVMPEMNGRDLAEKLLSLYPNLKLLFMSGYTANVIAHHGVLDRGVSFIQKPFSLKDLATKLREVLNSK